MSAEWPTGLDAWKAYAARCIRHYPLMATDWDAHHDYMKARRNAAVDASVSSGVPFEGDIPLSLEEEEELQNRTQTPQPAQPRMHENADTATGLLW